MSETDAAVDHGALVPGVHRVIRAIDGKEGPFAGTLVAFEESVAVCVDTETLQEWAGWAFSGSEHVCGVLDIRRRVDGHDALLPWCTQRVETFLGRREASGAPLTPGESGTLVASLLRGVRELGADGDVLGDWWLTGDGRPLFVHGDGGSARARTATLIERAARQQSDRATIRNLEEAASALRQPRHPVDDDRRWEEELFARAAPRALQLDVFAPERVSVVAPRLVAADAAARPIEGRRSRRAAGESRRAAGGSRRAEATRRALDAPRGAESSASSASAMLRTGMQEARAVMERLRERARVRRPARSRAAPRGRVDDARTAKPSRRRTVLVAGAFGIVVLIVGLLWPSDGGEAPAVATSQTGQTTEEPDALGDGEQPSPATAPPTPAPVPSDSASGQGGALDAVPGLLDAISACVEAAVEHCADAVAEGARSPSDGIVVLGTSGSTASLVDDYGDVAVIRLTPIDAGSGAAEQMMVLERHNDIWLVRDVYDVAHQPD